MRPPLGSGAALLTRGLPRQTCRIHWVQLRAATHTEQVLMSEAEYRAAIAEDISEQLASFPCQPVVFAGAGLSLRWFNAPNWQQLLEACIDNCPHVTRPFAYFNQQFAGDFPRIATALADAYREWAWSDGNNFFPRELFEAGVPGDAYLKHFVSDQILAIPTDVAGIQDAATLGEIEKFRAIRPHCLITTNYDRGLEAIFPDYEPAFRQDLVLSGFASIGEIVKIHGCATRPNSLVFTAADYQDFVSRRKYMSAKLLTFFTEHPILFVGYRASDPNVCGILADIDEALTIPGDLIPNIYFLERQPDGALQPARERLIRVDQNRSVRVKCIQTNDFSWVFEAFAHRAPLENVNPRILRAIMARSFHLVRSDIPRQTIEVDFDLISGQVESEESFAKLFGIASLQPATELAARYPHNLTQVGRLIGGNGWHLADRLLKRVREEKGVDVKSSDNRYHWEFATGNSRFKKYSDDCVEMLRRVNANEDYEVTLP